MDALDTPIVWDNGEPALQQFASITPDQAATPPVVPINTEGHVTSETARERELLLRHHGHRAAALDQDLVLPQLARGGSRGPLPGLAVVHDGHPHPEPRDPHLRPHRGQHRRPGAGGDRLGAAGGPVGVAHHPVAPPPPAGRGGRRPSSRCTSSPASISTTRSSRYDAVAGDPESRRLSRTPGRRTASRRRPARTATTGRRRGRAAEDRREDRRPGGASSAHRPAPRRRSQA